MVSPRNRAGDRPETIRNGSGRVIGQIIRQPRSTGRRNYRAEHVSGRWARFTGRQLAHEWIAQTERGTVTTWDGETEAWGEPAPWIGLTVRRYNSRRKLLEAKVIG